VKLSNGNPFAEAATFTALGSAGQESNEAPIDAHAVVRSGNMPAGVQNPRSVARAMLDAQDWLPFAAESYNISPKLEDMIIVPTTIFLTDIPNANLAAFPFEEMSMWNPVAGQITYRTWRGKPTYLEHANDDPTKAKGVILDASLRPVPSYIGNLHRVVLLNAWDRNRDPELAARIGAGRHGYSMGCWVSDYECSVCAASLRRGGCVHIHPKAGITIPRVGDKLTYRVARGCTGFECSAVSRPAFKSAVAEPIG
jgi:hypothetical protein